MRGRVLGVLAVVAVASVIGVLMSGCSPNEGSTPLMPPTQETKAEEAARNAAAAEIVARSEADRAANAGAVSGSSRLTFAGADPAPNGFAMMNSTGFKAAGSNWAVNKTVKFVPTGGSSGSDSYVLDVTQGDNGTIVGDLVFMRKMVLVSADTNEDYARITVKWTGKVTGSMKPDGKITGTVVGTQTNLETYFDKDSKPDIAAPVQFEWTFTGQK